MLANDIRLKYLDFFHARGHALIPHASLIPEHDPTLLFVNSGMFPLMPYLSGEPHPQGKRLTDVQPSFRTVDIERVGDQRHDTLFEMLGNWSLGDYGKKEQLTWWYEFLIDVLGLDIQRLYQSVYAGDGQVKKDTEAVQVMKEVFERYGIKGATEGPETIGPGEKGSGQSIEFAGAVRIFAYRDSNWWQRGDAVGELGGPDSETFYDTGKEHVLAFGKYCHINCDCGRFLEIGNSVFLEYKKTATGWQELLQKNIDFGAGLERLTMVVNQKKHIFETDLFAPLIATCEQLSGRSYADDPAAFEIVSDHIRAAVMLIGDSALPSNKDQGYDVRRLIRRAVQFADKLGIKQRLLADLTKSVIAIMGSYYQKLQQQQSHIITEIQKEEAKFRHTLEKGLRLLDTMVADGAISGEQAFDLFTTYGFPLEMTQEIAQTKNISIDVADYTQRMKQHQELSRAGSAQKFHGGLADHSEQSIKYHTATHLLHQALRNILGTHVEQRGSNITKDRLRFDFSHPHKMTEEEIRQAEAQVNEQIVRDLPVHYEIVPVGEAQKRGALGFFTDRYEDTVKIYQIGDYSLEICGGPHVEHTGVLGQFKIVKEQSSSASIRRIKAVLV